MEKPDLRSYLDCLYHFYIFCIVHATTGVALPVLSQTELSLAVVKKTRSNFIVADHI